MADTDSSSATVLPPAPATVAPRKQNTTPIGSKIVELNESRTELQIRIQGLKQDLQSWRSKLDTQVKIYREELTDLKKSLNDEVEQLRTEFQELRTTLQQQQDDISSSLKNLGPLDAAVEESKGAKAPEVNVKEEESTASEGEKVTNTDD
ncbi:hypothetical protein LINGRAHAP2_LOCUS30696 [Linum grandiflorum]